MSRLESASAIPPSAGPDDADAWVDPSNGVALAHRRFAIVTLQKPATSPCTRTTAGWSSSTTVSCTTTSEVRERKSKAYGDIAWRGHSDTEVLSKRIATIGHRFHSQASRRNVRIRPCGIVPLAPPDAGAGPARRKAALLRNIRQRRGSGLLFGSELKALARAPCSAGEIDRESLRPIRALGCVPGARSIYRGVHKLLAGHLDRARARPRCKPNRGPYWSTRDDALHGHSRPEVMPAEDELTERARRAVAPRCKGTDAGGRALRRVLVGRHR